MHTAGWVHRDVSAGNILVEVKGKVRLGDLEFAKKVNEGEEFRVVRDVYLASDGCPAILRDDYTGNRTVHICGS